MKTSKLIIILSFVLLAFTVGDSKSEYNIPYAPQSIFCNDIDLDGDIDIITGHSSPTWGGCGILLNDSNGYFSNKDSIAFNPGFPEANEDIIDNNQYADIFSTTVTNNPYTINISIIYNYGLSQFDSIKSFFIYDEGPLPFITSGDVNGNGFADLLFAHNNDFLWGIIYNDGTGNFSEPEYFDLTFPPVDINCADLNGDGKSEVVVCGSNTEIYYWEATGFEQQVLTTTTSHDVLLSDFDNDGDKDIITHRTLIYPTHRVFFFENLGNNQFSEHPYFDFFPFCSFAQIADFDNDSLPDMVFVAQDNSGLHIYNNMGGFQLEFDQFIFIDNYGAYLKRMACNDLDGNSFNDIATIRSGGNILPSNLNILFNDGLGNFQDNPITEIKIPKQETPNSIRIYPNPFKEKTTIAIKENNDKIKKLEIYDINGKLIMAYINKDIASGEYKFIWKGKDLNGKEVMPGIYLVRMQSDRKSYTQQMIVVK